MTWSLSYNQTQHLVEYVFEGNLRNSEVELAMKKGAALCREHDCFDVLIDSTGQERIESITVLYQHAGSGYAAEGIQRRRTHIAVILPNSSAMLENYSFYETVCHNRGWKVQTFMDREAAVEWLMAKKKTNKPDTGDS